MAVGSMNARQFQGLFEAVIPFKEAVSNPASISDGDELAGDLTIPGAELGDLVLVAASIDVADLVLSAQVTADDTVTWSLANNTGGAVDLAALTLTGVVFKTTGQVFQAL